VIVKTISIIIILSSIIKGELNQVAQDTSKSLIFKVFSIEDKALKRFGSGYIFDRIFRRREFHNPINFIPLEMRYGFSYNAGTNFLGLGGLKSNWMSYESEVKEFDGGKFSSRLGHQLDLDILKTNLAYYWFGNSWLDMHTGLNFRYSSLLFPSAIPEEWNVSQESWKLGEKFNGSMIELSWSQSLILQWFESWYSTYRYTYGLAFSQFYKKQNNLSGYGPSQSFTLGARYIVDTGMTNRFAVGVDFKYSHTAIKKIKDSKDITPINAFTIQTAGIYATASVFFGGRKTKGDTGKMYYYTGDYITSKRFLEEFVDENPNHANIARAKKLAVESERRIPYQLMREGMSFDKRGMIPKAVEKYIRAKSLADTLLTGVIEERLREIAYNEVERAEKWLNDGAGDTAIAHVTMVSGWYPGVRDHIKRFKITNLMNKGEQLYKIGLHNRALNYFDEALIMDSGLTFEIATYKHRIAVELLTMADQMKDINSLKFVVYALEETQNLTGGLSNTNSRILDELKRKLVAKENYEMREKIDQILNKEKKEKADEKSIEVGMVISEVEEIMGAPSEIISNDGNSANQLWIYRYQNGKEVLLTFTNYKLFRIEEQ